MSFVSYAQNFEDVMLWRALKHVEEGFYVDVGAQHPVIDSVSKAFYERGWRGIHIEPVPQYAELLRKDRTDETVLQVALGDAEGTHELNVIADTGLSTFVGAYAERHQVEKGYAHQRIQVPVLTLKSALQSLAGKDVHWLKIDVEGFEEKVLRGWDSQSVRPWIIVVEATIPNSPEIDYANWEPILTGAEYQFVYFDGLNRFYVAKEHAELAEAFSCPPNFFDDVALTANSYLCRGLIESHQASEKALSTQVENLATDINAANENVTRLQAHAEWLQKEWDAAKRRVEELCQSTGRMEAELTERNVQLRSHAEFLQTEWDAAKVKAAELNRELQSVYASKSWRITWPLRKTMQTVKLLLVLPMRTARWSLHLAKRVVKPPLVWATRKTLSNPRLKARASHLLVKYPRLKQQLRWLAIRWGLLNSWGKVSDSTYPFGPGSVRESNIGIAYRAGIREKSMENLSPRAAQIFAELKSAIEASKR